jgi:tetratricopeptide (TPR) repeat protein
MCKSDVDKALGLYKKAQVLVFGQDKPQKALSLLLEADRLFNRLVYNEERYGLLEAYTKNTGLLAHVFTQIGEVEKAIELYQSMFRTLPHQIYHNKFYNLRVLLAEEKNSYGVLLAIHFRDYAKAIAVFDEVIALLEPLIEPKSSLLSVKMNAALVLEGDTTPVYKYKGELARAYYYMGLTLFEDSELPQAQGYAESAMKLLVPLADQPDPESNSQEFYREELARCCYLKATIKIKQRALKEARDLHIQAIGLLEGRKDSIATQLRSAIKQSFGNLTVE